MPNKRSDTGAKSTKATVNSTWFKNTLKSLGNAGGAMIKDIMPATADSLGSATTTASDIVKSIRSSRTGVGNITKNLTNNQVIRSGQQFFKNAIDDVKSGKFYNTERDGLGMGGNDELDPDSLFGDVEDVSFSDFGDEAPAQVNVVNQDIQQGDNGATLKAIERSTEYNLQATKATVDTMVSISSTNMLNINRISEEITNQLTAINSNLTALIEYNNTNMTKFIDASIGYYEQMSAKANETQQSTTIGPNDIYTMNGGLDFKKYGEFVKQNAKNAASGSMVGGTLSMVLENKDLLIGGLVANPLGTVMKTAMKAALPQITKSAAKALDESIKDFIPVMLERIGSFDEITGPFSGVSRFIAKTFGIKTERKEKFDLSKITKGPVPYNGMANTAIVEIIPKHLREANSYLRTIAETLSGRFGEDAKGPETGFDWETGEFKDIAEIRKKFYDSLEETTTGTFRNSQFGQKMASQKSLLKSQEDRDKYDEALNQLYGAIERHRGTIDFKNQDHMKEIIDSISSTQNIKTLIESYINHLQDTADSAIGNAIATKAKVTREKNRAMQDAEDRADEKNLRNFVNTKGYDQYIKEKYSGQGATQSQGGAGSAKAQISLHGVVSNIYDLLNRGIYVRIKKFEDRTPWIQPVQPIAPVGGITPSQSATQTAEEFKARFNEQSAATTDINGDENLGDLSLRDRFGRKSAKQINMFKGVIDGIMAGNSDKAFDEMMNAIRDKFHKAGEWISEKFFTPIKEKLFGEKDDDGYTRGGIFEGINNRMRESFFSLRRLITGKGYLTADGEKIEDANEDEMKNTVKGKLQGVLSFVRDSLKEKLFGKKPDEETGEDGKEGLLGKARKKLQSGVNALTKGLLGWKKALFGGSEDENSEEDGKKVWANVKEKAKDILPTALAGSVVGVTGAALLGSGGLMGMLVAGPVAGAMLGLAGGIAAKSDKFKDWLFGPEDKDGKRIGGVISEKVQDYFHDNGKYLAGGAILGLAKGWLMPGTGVLTSMVGGPLMGAVMGIGTSILFRSRMFQNFLFGNEETGQKGLINTVKGWFGKLGRNKDGDPNTGKLLGMAGIGVGAGALTGQMILNSGILGLSLGPMGPIGGALLGLGGAILAQKKNFKEWLFGTVDPDTGEKRLGIFGKFANMLSVNVLEPMKNTFVHLGRKVGHFVEHDVLTKFNLIIEPIGNLIFGSISKFTGRAVDSLAGVGQVIKENFLVPTLEKITGFLKPIGDAARLVATGIANVGMQVIKAPMNVLYAITSPIAQAAAKTAQTVASVAVGTVKWAVVKPIKNFVITPLVKAVDIATKVISAPFKLVGSIASTIHKKVSQFTAKAGIFLSNMGNAFKDWLLVKNPIARFVRGFGKRVKDFGARVKNTFKIMVKPMTDFVKTALSEVKNHIISGISKFFSFINPINIIKGLYNIMRGRKANDKKDPSKMGFLRRAWYLADPDVYGYDDADPEMWKTGTQKQRRRQANKNSKYGWAKTVYTDNRDGTTYTPLKNGSGVLVKTKTGKKDIISNDEFNKRFPVSERDNMMKKTVDESGATVEPILSKKKTGNTFSKYDIKKSHQEDVDRNWNKKQIDKWTKHQKKDDTTENRILAQKNAEAKGHKIVWRNVATEDEKLQKLRERMGEDTLKAEEATAENTKSTVDILDKIYYSAKFGWGVTEDDIKWYKANRQKIKDKRHFLNGRTKGIDYDSVEATQMGASQAHTLENEADMGVGRKETKRNADKFSRTRRDRAEDNFEKHGFWGGLWRNVKDFGNYVKGGTKQIWHGETPDELKDTERHASGGTKTGTQPSVTSAGEAGAELYQPAGSSRKYIIGEDGAFYMMMFPGDKIYPNSVVQQGTSDGDMSSLTDRDLISITDTSKLTVSERILHELMGINQNLKAVGVSRSGFLGSGSGISSDELDALIDSGLYEEDGEPEFDENGNLIIDRGEYKGKNLSKLFRMSRAGLGGIFSSIPGSGIVKDVAHGVGNVFDFGKTVVGAGFESIYNVGTFGRHMFGHAKDAVGGAINAVKSSGSKYTDSELKEIEQLEKYYGRKLTDAEKDKYLGKSSDAKVVDAKSTSETEEEREKRESEENAAQQDVSGKTAEARQAERHAVEEEAGDNARDEERNSLLKKISDKFSGLTGVWGKIFSKKGLITGAILAAGGLLSKFAPFLFAWGKTAIAGLPTVSEIKNKIIGLKDKIPSWQQIKAWIASVPEKIRGAWDWTKEKAMNAWDWTYDRFGDVIDTGKQWGINVGNQFKDDAIYGWNNLGDGKRPVDKLEDEAVRFTRIANRDGLLDNESEARAKLKYRAWSGYANYGVNALSNGRYAGLTDWSTNKRGIRGLWDRIKTSASRWTGKDGRVIPGLVGEESERLMNLATGNLNATQMVEGMPTKYGTRGILGGATSGWLGHGAAETMAADAMSDAAFAADPELANFFYQNQARIDPNFVASNNSFDDFAKMYGGDLGKFQSEMATVNLNAERDALKFGERTGGFNLNNANMDLFRESDDITGAASKKWSFATSKLNPKNWFGRGAAATADDFAEAAVKSSGSLKAVTEAGEAAAKTATENIAENAAKVAGAKAATEDSLWKKAIGMLEKGMTSVVDKVGAKLGSSKAVQGAGKGVQKIMSGVGKCKKFFSKVASKVSAVLGVTAALGATVVGLAGKEVTWITIGALNGLTGAQRLFRTDDVDTTMKIISTVIGGLLGTTVGSIIDIINELVVSVTGMDIISELATVIYTAIMDFSGNAELSEKLRESQAEFKHKFEDDKIKSLKDQYSTMMQAGLLDKTVSEAEFIQGVEEGKYGARIQSFAEYNDDQHKTMGATVLSKAKGGLTNIKESMIGKTTTTYTDKLGNVYTDAGDGMWLVTNKDGKELGTVGKDAIPEDASETVEHTDGVLLKIGKGLLKILKPVLSVLGTVVPVMAADAANMFGGDPGAIISNMPDIEEDTPGAGISKALLFLTKGLMLPGSIVWWGMHKLILPAIGPVIDGVASAVTGVVGSISHNIGAFINGDLMELWGGGWDLKTHGGDDGAASNVGAGFAYVTDVATRLVLTPFTLMSAGVHLIVDPILGITHGIGDDWDKMTDSIGKSWEFANNGEPGKVWTDTTFTCEDGDIIAPVFHVISAVNNVFATIWGGIKWVVNKVSDFFGGIWDFIKSPFSWLFGDDDDDSVSESMSVLRDHTTTTTTVAVPTHARGTQNALGGLSIVGERGVEAVYSKNANSGRLVGQNGPEVVNLKRGDTVIPNSRINATLSSDGLSKLSDTQLGKVSDTRQLTVSERILKAVSENEDSEGTKKFQETELKNSVTSNKTLSDITAVLRAGFGLDKNNNPIATTNKNIARSAGISGGKSSILSKTSSGSSTKRKATWYEYPETAYGAYTPAGQTLISGYSVAANPADYPGGTILEITGGGLDGTYRVDDNGCDQGTIDFFYNTGKVPATFRRDGTYSINVKAVGGSGVGGSGEDDSNETSEQKAATVQRPTGDKLTQIVNESTEKIAPRVAKAEQSGELKTTVTEDPHKKRFGKTITNLQETQNINDSTYYSQNDPRWANIKFTRSDGKDDGSTMHSTGCGPTAMAMALSDMTDSTITPLHLAQLAQKDGYRDDTGVNSAFINAAASEYHVNSSETRNPSISAIESGVEHGEPVVLLGKRPSTLRNDISSPYTTSGHYIVANGFDRYGNVMISDPRGRKYNVAVSPKDLARDTSVMWTFNGNNPMLKRKKQFKRYRRGGYGNEYLSWLQGDSRWGSKQLGNSGQTMAESGCWVTTLAKLAMHTNCIDEPSFNPGWLCEYLTKHNAFDSSGELNTAILRNIGLSRKGYTSLRGKSVEYVTNECAKYINDGYAVALWVNTKHVVAIVDIQNGQLVMSDPAQNGDTNPFSYYDISNVDGITYLQGASSPKKVNFEYSGDDSAGVLETAKKIIEPVAEIGGAFAKLASAIFKAIFTGNWDIDWDSVFADESETATQTTSTGTSIGYSPSQYDGNTGMSITPDNYTSKDVPDYIVPYYSYLRKLGFNEYGASALLSYMYSISNDNKEKRFNPAKTPDKFGYTYATPNINLHDTNIKLLPSLSEYTPSQYTFMVNSGLYGRNNFMYDATAHDKGVPYGLLQWNSSQIKGKLYDATVKNHKRIDDPTAQMDFIKSDLSSYNDTLYNAMTNHDGDYSTILSVLPDYISSVSGQDINTTTMANMMMSIYHYMSDNNIPLVDMPSTTDDDYAIYKKWISNEDYLKMYNILQHTGKGHRTKPLDGGNDYFDTLTRTYNNNFGFLDPSSLQEQDAAIDAIYKSYGSHIPDALRRQIYKNRSPVEFYALAKYLTMKNAVANLSNENQPYVQSLITNLENAGVDKIPDKIKLAENEYEKDNNILYTSIVTNHGSLSDVDARSLGFGGVMQKLMGTDPYDTELLRRIFQMSKNNPYAALYIANEIASGNKVAIDIAGLSSLLEVPRITIYKNPKTNKYSYPSKELADSTRAGYNEKLRKELDKISWISNRLRKRIAPQISSSKPTNINGTLEERLRLHLLNRAKYSPSVDNKYPLIGLAHKNTAKDGSIPNYTLEELHRPFETGVYGHRDNVSDYLKLDYGNTKKSRIYTEDDFRYLIKRTDEEGHTGLPYAMLSDRHWNVNMPNKKYDIPFSFIGTHVPDNDQTVSDINEQRAINQASANYDQKSSDGAVYNVVNPGVNTSPTGGKTTRTQVAVRGGIPSHSGSSGGFGDGVNGTTYYSQNDPRWADTKFIKSNGVDDGATMSNTGCGPTAMAMALSDATGNDINPLETASLAQMMGSRDDTGVNWNFIRDGAMAYGVSTLQSINPSREFILNSVKTGSPVILSGQSRGETNSPYTTSGHYVVATGVDNHNNITINDPRGQSYNKTIPISELTRETGSAWLFGRNPSLRSRFTRYENKRHGGRGNSDWRSWIQSDERWGSLPLGTGGCTVASHGCAVVSCAKIIMLTNSTSDSNFNPAVLVEYLNNNGGFSGSDLIWSALPYITCEGSANFDVLTKSNIASVVKSLMDEGYGVILECDNGNHWIPVMSVDGDRIIMADSARNRSDDFFAEYPPESCCTYKWFKGSMSPMSTAGTAQSNATQAETDEFSKASSIASKAGTAILKAGYTGDWNIDWDAVFADNVATSDATTGATGSTSVRGNSNAEQIFNYFKDNTNFTDAGIAGIMGNWNMESGLYPNNLENSFESELGYNDQTYSDAISNGSYTRDQFIHDAEHRESYVRNCGKPVGAGYGLGQWTTGARKGGLYDATVGKGLRIDDMGGQLAYALSEISGNSDLMSILASTDSPYDAASEFLAKFEGCPGHSSLPNRQSYASDFYNQFHGGSGIGHGATFPKEGTHAAANYKQFIREFKKKKQHGGRGDMPTVKSVKFINQTHSNIPSTTDSMTQDSSNWLPSSSMSYEEQRVVSRSYSENTSLEKMERLMGEVINTLNGIYGNTGNLSYLKDINSSMSDSHNTYIANNTTNNISNGNKTTNRVGQKKTGPSHNETMARRIAFGQ